MCNQIFIGWNCCARNFNAMNMGLRNDEDLRTRSLGSKDPNGRIFKYEAFLRIDAQFFGGKFVAFWIGLSGRHILRGNQDFG